MRDKKSVRERQRVTQLWKRELALWLTADWRGKHHQNPRSPTSTSKGAKEIIYIVPENVRTWVFFPDLDGRQWNDRGCWKNMKVESRGNEKKALEWNGNVSLGTFIRKWGNRTWRSWVTFCRILHPIFCYILHATEEQSPYILLVLWCGLIWWFRRLAERLALAYCSKNRHKFDLRLIYLMRCFFDFVLL